jgi:hypothetical protein
MKSKYLQCIFYLTTDEVHGTYTWHTDYIDFLKHEQHTGSPNRAQYYGKGGIFMNLPLIFDMEFRKPNKFMQFSNNYDFRKVTPFTARLAR